MPSLASLLDAAPSAVIAVDGAGRICYGNALVADLWGYDVADLVGQAVWTLVPDRLVADYRTLLDEMLADPTPRTVASAQLFTARHRDGHEFPVEAGLLTAYAEDGRLWLVAGVVDITARVAAQERLSTLGRAYLTLAQIHQAIIRAADEEELYAEACRVAVEVGGYRGAWVGVPGPGGTVRTAAAAGVATAYAARLALTLDPDEPAGRAPAAVALREGRACWSEDFLNDPTTAPWREHAQELRIRASASLPLRTDDGTVAAVLTFYSDSPGFFDGTMRELLEQVAENVCFALSSFSARRQLETVAAQRRELLRRLVGAQEEERRRIAADLHDESVQALAAVDLRLGLVAERLPEGDPALRAALGDAQESVSRVIAGLRDLLFDLEPDDLQVSWPGAVREAVLRTLDGHGLTWTVEVEDGAALAAPERAQALRILREALRNVRSHARARTVEVRVHARDGGAEVVVADDGVGFDLDEAVRRRGHRGLETMRDRAEVSGGWLRWEPRDGGAGTVVRFWLPGAGS